jgi:hypothetical protein
MLASAADVDGDKLAEHIRYINGMFEENRDALFERLAQEALELLQGTWRNMNLALEVTIDKDGREREFTTDDAVTCVVWAHLSGYTLDTRHMGAERKPWPELTARVEELKVSSRSNRRRNSSHTRSSRR